MPLLRRTLRSCAFVTGRIGNAPDHPAKTRTLAPFGGASHSLAAFGGARFAHGRPSLRLGIPPALAPSPKKARVNPAPSAPLLFLARALRTGQRRAPLCLAPSAPVGRRAGFPCSSRSGGSAPAFGGLLPRLCPPRVFARLRSAGAPLPFLCLARPKSGGGIRPQLARALWRLSAPSCAFRRRVAPSARE